MTSVVEHYRRWSKADYLKMAQTGILADGERTELFEGIILTMSPNNPPHANAVSRLNMLLTRHFSGHIVRVQLPLDVKGDSLPEPDFAIVTEDSIRPDAHPREAVLVIEVADSSLHYDRHEKSSLYARSEIQEYWILNIPDQVLEIYREPGSDSEAPLGWGYRRRVVLDTTEPASPLSLPEARLMVEKMF
jgi:Uma2 family endonuclease